MQKEIAGFRKGWAVNYSTSVTATKGEQIAIWTCVLLMFCGVLLALFVLKSILVFVLSIVGGIILLFAVVLFCIFRGKHKEERLQNTVMTSGKVNEAWCNIPGLIRDSEKQEEEL